MILTILSFHCFLILSNIELNKSHKGEGKINHVTITCSNNPFIVMPDKMLF